MKIIAFRILLFVSCVYLILDADRYFSTATQETIATSVPYCLLALGIFGIVMAAIRYIRTRTWCNKSVGDLLLAFSVTGWSLLWIWRDRGAHHDTGVAGTVFLVAVAFASLVALFWGGQLLRKTKRDRIR